MKVNDLVMFTNADSRYAKWFFGQLAVVEKISNPHVSCRVRWLTPVKYYSGYTSSSDFHQSDFTTFNEEENA